MSQFDDTNLRKYFDKLRTFLPGFERTTPPHIPVHRLGPPTPAAIAWAEELVNRRAARAESLQTTLPERICIARDYSRGRLTDAKLNRILGICRAQYRRWESGRIRPEHLGGLASALAVPVKWLRHGGEEHLPADSQVGVRVGAEALDWRRMLHDLTVAATGGNLETGSVAEMQQALEQLVRTNPSLATAARRAGGRWQVTSRRAGIVFAPWVPTPRPRGGGYPPATEAIIREELSVGHTVLAAAQAIAVRCTAAGLPHPGYLGMLKRMERAHKHVERYGMDLSQEIPAR